FNTSNRRGPLVQRKSVGDPFGQSVRRITPTVISGSSVDFFLEIDIIGRYASSDALLLVLSLVVRSRVPAVWRTQQEMRQAKRDVSRVFTVAEGTPGNEFGAFEDLGEIARIAKLFKRIHVEHLRTRSGNEWRMGGRGYIRHLLEPLDVLGTTS